MSTVIEIRERAPARASYEAPHRLFISASLALGIGGGFMLAIALPLARLAAWDWGQDWQTLAQVHGQLQLLGFGALFTAGMAFRLMPRFSGRPLAHMALVPWVIAGIAASLLLRALAQPAADSAMRDTGLIGSAALFVAGAAAFATIVWRTLLHPASRAGATGAFFCAGALGFVASAALNAAIVAEMVRDGMAIAPVAKQGVLVVVEQYGSNLMFVCGVGTRAVPMLTGHERPERPANIAV